MTGPSFASADTASATSDAPAVDVQPSPSRSSTVEPSSAPRPSSVPLRETPTEALSDGAGYRQAASAVFDVVRSSGQPLSDQIREDMESRLGADFSHVRIHTDRSAHTAAELINARAFTAGHHIGIRESTPDPLSTEGHATLAHELTHVAQHRSDINVRPDDYDGISLSDPTDPFEREATLISEHIEGASQLPHISSTTTRATEKPRASLLVSRAVEPGPPAPVNAALTGKVTISGVEDPILTAIASNASNAGELLPLTPTELTAINVDAGTELRRLAGNAITAAVGQFAAACDALKSDLDKRAKQQSELVALVADIMAGFAAPALAGAAATDVLANSVLRKTLAVTAKAARVSDLGAMASEIDILGVLERRGATLSPTFWDKVTGDHIKTTFVSAFKGGTGAIKMAGPALLTGDKKTVVSELSSLALLVRQDLDRSLASKSVAELFALVVTLDSTVANAATYGSAISRYLREVLPINSEGPGGGTTQLVRMNAYGGWRLAIVESGWSGLIIGTPYDDFISWVSPGFQAVALDRAGLPVGRAPLHDVLLMVPLMDPAKMSGSGAQLPPPTPEDSVILPI